VRNKTTGRALTVGLHMTWTNGGFGSKLLQSLVGEDNGPRLAKLRTTELSMNITV